MIHEIILRDPERNVSPPEKVLRLSAVGDLAFLRIERYDETDKGISTEIIAEFMVSRPALLEAVQAISNDVNREHMRPKDERGIQPDIPGYRHVVVPI